jgi:hypothetical protein
MGDKKSALKGFGMLPSTRRGSISDRLIRGYDLPIDGLKLMTFDAFVRPVCCGILPEVCKHRKLLKIVLLDLP